MTAITMLHTNATLHPCPGSYTGKRVLVTGAGGYIGRRIVESLSSVACEIVAISQQDLVLGEAAKASMKVVRGMFHDPAVIAQALDGDVDVVFHLAAQTSIYMAAQDPLGDLSCNVAGSLLLLEGLRQQNAKKATVIFSSTATIVGLTELLPVDEAVPDSPLTLYDIDKLTTEHHLQFYVSQGWCLGGALRLSNVYGPGYETSSVDRGIITKMISRAAAGQSLAVFGSGDYIRDFIYISDVVSAFLAAGENGAALQGRAYNVGSGQGVSLKDAFTHIAERVSSLMGVEISVTQAEMPQELSVIETRNYVANISAFNSVTQWNPRVTFAPGMDATIDFVMKSGARS